MCQKHFLTGSYNFLWPRNSSQFMENKRSLPCRQKHITVRHSDPDEFSLQSHAIFASYFNAVFPSVFVRSLQYIQPAHYTNL
jgi:hypothetical protein